MTTPVQWAGEKDNMWKPTGETTAALPPGHYAHYEVQGMFGKEVFLSKQEPKHDKAIIVADSISNHIIDSIKRFKGAKETYKRFNQLHKRGMLLEGPAGSGKSMSAMLASEWHVAEGGIVVYPYHPAAFGSLPRMLEQIRKIHANLDILCILEDIDNNYYQEDEEMLLGMLDGMFQVGNVYYILTTNHVEQLSERLINRPKRIDEVIHVGPPSIEARRSYLNGIIPEDQAMRKEVIDALANASDGLMLAHLSELMISYLVLDHPLEEVAARLKKMNEPDNDDDIMGAADMPPVIQLHVSRDDLRAKPKRRR